jgi:hypothetical protein
MPSVYEVFGAPSGQVEYVIWSHRDAAGPRAMDVAANEVSLAWLRALGLVQTADAAPARQARGQAG